MEANKPTSADARTGSAAALSSDASRKAIVATEPSAPQTTGT
eukprot:CAMPEP_0195334304 /NCGR_PEP_ID=MMETSP0708-20121125/14708_1 /TAXON_ID=33640 /ORGANISM="Asterionellopsis glacialis, Strain CCMP134" /LENGTH=41 /DNA_ID= /DNA_START= /DNA_END= /DNA_ORIENTATION=